MSDSKLNCNARLGFYKEIGMFVELIVLSVLCVGAVGYALLELFED